MNEFINTGIDYAITMYLRSKDHPNSPLFNSFLVVVMRALVCIYGENRIIEPYSRNEVHNFQDNIKKYGYQRFNEFRNYIQRYYEWAKKVNENKGQKSLELVLIQQELIDMFALRLKKDGSNEELKNTFASFLYTSNNPDQNMVLFNVQYAIDSNIIEFYWKKAMFNVDNQLVITYKKNNLLNPKFYNLLNLTFEEVQGLSEKEIATKNEEVYKKLKVNVNDEGFLTKLENAFNKYYIPDLELSGGSGFVDRVLLVSILITIVSVAFIAIIAIFR